jgi:hypothetical protein
MFPPAKVRPYNIIGAIFSSIHTCRLCTGVSVSLCPDLTAPENGNIKYTDNAEGIAYYYCNEGYVFDGPSQRLCQARKRGTEYKWTCRAPTCESKGIMPRRFSLSILFASPVIHCPELTAPINGGVKVTNSTNGGIAHFLAVRMVTNWLAVVNVNAPMEVCGLASIPPADVS